VTIDNKHVDIVFLHRLILWMMSFYLLADIASGFFVLQIGIDLKLSLIYKLVLFILLLSMIARYQFTTFLILWCVIAILLLSPTVEYFRLPVLAFYIADTSLVIKLLMPLIVFIYLSIIHQIIPSYTIKWITFALWANFTILIGNLALGGLGFGRPSYQLAGDATVGSNGYIYAANELGAAFVVLFGFALHMVWNYHRKFYILVALFTLACGVLVATKTAMLASFLLVFLIPVFNERDRFFKLTKLKIILFLPAFCIVAAVVFFITDFLKAIGSYDHIMWILSQKGIIGILWSGRDEFSADLLDIYIQQSTLFQQIFGQGGGGVAEHVGLKYSAEVDAIDALVWFGFFGLIICLSINLFFIVKSAQLFQFRTSLMAPCVLLVNIILLFLSQFSGHVWMSGTLGIGLGLLNALLLLEKGQEVKQC